MSDEKRLYGGSKAVAKCYEPFADVDAANAAVSGFMQDLYELRLKHHISDVLVTIRDSVISDEDIIGTVMLHSRFGNETTAEVMAAYTLGRVSEERQQMIRHAAATKAIHPLQEGR